jgi:hypothetical protein
MQTSTPVAWADATLLIVFNAHHDVVRFRLPLYYEDYEAYGWTRLIDTIAPVLPAGKFRGGAAYKVTGRSLLLFERLAVEVKVAPLSTQLRVECAVFGPFGGRERLIEDGEGAIGVARTGFRPGKRNLDQPVEVHDLLFAQHFDAATHALKPAAGRTALSARHALEKDPIRSPEGQKCSRARLASSAPFDAARERSQRINSKQGHE